MDSIEPSIIALQRRVDELAMQVIWARQFETLNENLTHFNQVLTELKSNYDTLMLDTPSSIKNELHIWALERISLRIQALEESLK